MRDSDLCSEKSSFFSASLAGKPSRTETTTARMVTAPAMGVRELSAAVGRYLNIYIKINFILRYLEAPCIVFQKQGLRPSLGIFNQIDHTLQHSKTFVF